MKIIKIKREICKANLVKKRMAEKGYTNVYVRNK